MSTEDRSAEESTDAQIAEPTNLHRDKRPKVHGRGPDVSRNADGSIHRIQIEVSSGSYDDRSPKVRQLALTYYVNDGRAHLKTMENAHSKGDAVSRKHLRMLALADDVVGRVPGVESVTRIEDEISKTRETYARELDERCTEEGCYEMPDKALDSGRCREHTPREER